LPVLKKALLCSPFKTDEIQNKKTMVKIRLARRGRKKLAMFDVVVADARSPRDGKFIEKIGTYNPQTVPASIVLEDERAFHWLMNGAQAFRHYPCRAFLPWNHV